MYHKTIHHLCRYAALFGGLLLFGLAVMLCITIVGRKLFAWQVNGDYEIVQMVGALATSLLFPWCQLTGGHISVDVFTMGLPKVAQGALDRVGGLLIGVLMASLAWRTVVLAIQNEASGAMSAVLGWPVWIFQASLVPGLALTALVSMQTSLSRKALSSAVSEF